MGGVILTIKDIDKSLVGVHALKNACLEPKKGEVHALMGENSAGKSTLTKISTGIYSKDSGIIVYEGRQAEFKSLREAQNASVVITRQELNMMNRLTAAQNIFIGKKKMNGKLINDRRMVEETEKLSELLSIRIDPRETTGRLAVGHQQMCEMIKTIPVDAKIIVSDEPIAVSTDSGVGELFRIIRDLRAKGIRTIYISHYMGEVSQTTGRATVMRSGKYAGTLITKDPTKDDVIQMMVGHTMYEEPKSFSNVKSSVPVVLKVEHLNVRKTIKDVSFELRRREILGFSGLMGAGKTETTRVTSGADRGDSGDIYMNGKRMDTKDPQDAVDARIGYLSEDHKRCSVITEKTVAEDTTVVSLKTSCKGLFIDKKAEKETVEQYVEVLKTKTPSVEQQVHSLSEGNQQKVVIAKWLTRSCNTLVFDEPTRGIDVGAKSKIYTLMNNLVKQGKSIIMIFSELAEVLRMSDHISVMCGGRKTEEIDIRETTWEKIMHTATPRD